MYITIGKPYAVCEKGGRANNEDAIYPQPEAVGSDQKLFIVCDGVGGSDKGEIASTMACDLFQSYLASFMDGEPTLQVLEKALQYTEVHFDEYTSRHPEAQGMATTLALVYFGAGGVVVAHLGDSRVYHFRKGQILFQTEDHSLVNSLVKLNVIQKEDMRTHPQRNVILRAIQGASKPTEIDVTLLNDVEDGDYIFLCTDGVLEQFPNEKLASLFRENKPSKRIKDEILDVCNEKTKDNYSFYIIPIQNVRDRGSIKQNVLSFFYSLA